MEVLQHFSHKEHPLIFVEDLENEVVCSGCKESVWGGAYKCSECNFFLHKSCAELPPEIQHSLHPNHTFVLQLPSQLKLCEACYGSCENSFFYHCNTCDFEGLHVECASGWRTKPDNCHQHEFVPIFQQIHFTCEACGEDCNSFAQVCRICQLLVHTECTEMPRSIRIIADRHLLTLIYSLGKVMKEHDDHVFCNLCYKKLKLKYGGYYCRECDFVTHLECARQNWIGPSDTIDSSRDLIEDINLEEDEEPEVVKHLDHKHYLIISRNEREIYDRKRCEGCMQSITAPFYSCEQCNYFLHSTCARLPLKIRHPKHRHLLTLSARGNLIDGIVNCNACGCYGFAYKCHDCDYSLDIRCCLIPKTFKHEGHQHSLFHAISSVEKCSACDRSKNNNGVFVCTKCNSALGFECATLPLKAKYEYDPHPLSLIYTVENDSGEFYCLICEEERNPNHWFYYCVKCNFAAHPQCVVGRHPYIKYGRNFTRKNHQHPLNFVRRTKESHPCNACSETFDEDAAVNCTQCKSIIHLWDKCLYKLF
ncbi:uncharacterized protein LOC132163892 [Corylus avellana]|uniref:uncharacterized protein LOC132163892 n=1 Tax=Corylus avellana TaxID=13451 RepID=UPI00286A5641|nr:uncharacterized protein LOC132163892 [Corylus avellana]